MKTELECQFAKYGFEKHEDCVILTKVGSWLIGYVKNVTKAPKPAMWFEYDGSSSISTLPNLQAIKKPWYETCTFPCIIMADYCMPVVVKHYEDGYVYDFRDNKYCVNSWRLLTNDEIEGLKQ